MTDIDRACVLLEKTLPYLERHYLNSAPGFGIEAKKIADMILELIRKIRGDNEGRNLGRF